MNFTDIAMRIALEAHGGTINKHDGELYILHVHRVASNFNPFTEPLQYATAWLHDVVEDTDVTAWDIEGALFKADDYDEMPDNPASRVKAAVAVLTKDGQLSNEDYYNQLVVNPIARAVKIADIHDNFGRNYRIEDEATRLRMAAKYSLGIEILCRQR